MNNTTKNGKKLFSLRVNHYTVILVPEEKNNEQYAQKVRARIAKTGGCGNMRYISD